VWVWVWVWVWVGGVGVGVGVFISDNSELLTTRFVLAEGTRQVYSAYRSIILKTNESCIKSRTDLLLCFQRQDP
jgi:hypothetical protein